MTWLALLGALWLVTAFVLAPLVGRCLASADRRATAEADERFDRDLRRLLATDAPLALPQLDETTPHRPIG